MEFLGFQNFEILFIYERILNRITYNLNIWYILALVFADSHICDWICKNPHLHTKSEINFRPLLVSHPRILILAMHAGGHYHYSIMLLKLYVFQ